MNSGTSGGWRGRQTICGLAELGGQDGVTHLLSILDPDWPEPDYFGAPLERLTLRFHDLITPIPGYVLPAPEHVEALLAFGRGLPADGEAHLLVHCHAGVSRSTAAMAALLLQADPDSDEDAVLRRIARIRPQAWPNSRMIVMADQQLGRGGRLVEALRRFYARQIDAMPAFAEELARGGRAAEVAMARDYGT